jgi:hypothetical protein
LSLPEIFRAALGHISVQYERDKCPQRTTLNGPIAQKLKVMATAFENAQMPSEKIQGKRARRQRALLVMRHIRRGERDAVRLADLAALDFLR